MARLVGLANRMLSRLLKTAAIRFCVATALAFVLSGCLGGHEEKPVSTSRATLTNITLKTYDRSTATVLVQGSLYIKGAIDLSFIRFHSTEACQDQGIGQGLLSDFHYKGIELQIPSAGTTRLYVSTNTYDGCFYLTSYTPPHDAPPAPVLKSTSPVSPSRVSTTPLAYGEAAATAQEVRLYDDATCSRLVGLGTPKAFATIGIPITLQPNTRSKIYGRAVEPFGNASACTEIGAYAHSDYGPPPPTFVSSHPISPSHVTSSPLIIGATPAEVTTVSLFKDAACLLHVGNGPAADFKSTGLAVELPANAETGIYAVGYDAEGNPSLCNYLFTYKHDSTIPDPPVFVSATPASPTRLTLYPRIKGTASADTAVIKFYNDMACLRNVGTGTKAEFEGIGVIAAVQQNNSTSLYATSVDAAGNASNCTLMTTYFHNTIPPEPPGFIETLPASPNNTSTMPYVVGSINGRGVQVELFSNETCTTRIGMGTAQEFTSTGVRATVPANSLTTIYATTIDPEGNVSTCASMTNYDHSANPAIPPAFTLASPPSPSKQTDRPYIVGTADSSIRDVAIYIDNMCQTKIAQGTRAAFVTSGLQVQVYRDAATPIYAVSFDKYGNFSACTQLTTYIYNTKPPFDPMFTATIPTSPNNTSFSPMVRGTTTVDPTNVLPVANVRFFDTMFCLSQIGIGTPAEFASTGIRVEVSPNMITSIYGQTIDAAGNVSNCTFLTDYTHIDIAPGLPHYVATSPASPSYSELALLTGTIGTSTSFMPIQNVNIYTDSNCTATLKVGLPSEFTGSGIAITTPMNATTSLYAQSSDQVGNKSACAHMTNFRHHNLGPIDVNVSQNLDGSVSLGWLPDLISNPSPRYIVKRSLKAGGPYTILNNNVIGTAYTDLAVTNGTTYYYVVASTNNTGTSQDSAEVSLTVTAPNPNSALSLTALPGPTNVSLSWSGDSTNMTFKVMRSLKPGGPYTTIASKLVSPSYIDDTVTDGTLYFYVVHGSNPAGDSVQSNEANARPMGAPDAPINLNLALKADACGAGNAGVVLTWSAPAYFTEFFVYRSNNSGGGGTLRATRTMNSWIDCNPDSYWNNSNANANYYTVSAGWSGTQSQTSNEVAFANLWPPGLSLFPGNGHIQVAWNTDTQADSYTLLRATKPGGPYTILANHTTVNSYNDTGLTNGIAYYYVIRAHYPGGLTGWDFVERSAIPGTNPTDPSNLNLTVNAQGLPVLDWTRPSVFNRFRIHRSANPGGPFSVIATNSTSTSPPTRYMDPSPLNGMNYYRVTATWGSYESNPTNVVSYRGGIPKNLVLTPAANSIGLAWTAVTGANGYRIYRGTTMGGPYTSIGTSATNSYTDSSAVTGVGYYYTVTSTYLDGTESQKSAEVNGMRTDSAVPSGLSVTAVTANSIAIAWAKVQGATSYNIYVAVSPSTTYVKVANATATSYLRAGLSPGGEYNFKVSSVTGTTESSLSAPLTQMTLAALAAPTLTAGSNSVLVQWSGVTGASHNVERSTDGTTFSTVCPAVAINYCTDATAVNGTQYYYRVVATVSGYTITSPTSTITPGIVPSVPAGLAVTENITGDELKITFSGAPAATSYRIYVGTSPGNYNMPIVNATQTTDVAIPGLTAATTYYIAASALIGSVESARSAEISAIPLLTPAAPTALANSATSIRIAWSSAHGTVTNYDLLRSNDGVNFSAIATGLGTATAYTDSTAVAGVSYQYIYQPYGAGGVPMARSAASPQVTIGIAPLEPRSLTARAVSTTSVNLIWGQVTNIGKYNVYRATSAGGPYSLRGSTTASTTTYTDAGTAGTTYYYVVRSVNDYNVESPNSNEVAVELNAGPATLAVTANSNRLNLAWSAVAGAASYQVRRSEIAGGPYGVIASGVAGTSLQDTNVVNGVRYYYVVEAVFASGAVSVSSNEASAIALITMNLQSAVELLDRGLLSSTVARTFERSRTSLNTNDYDGSPSYQLEVVAYNVDSAPLQVELLNNSNVTVGFVTIPAGVSAPTRLRASFTPSAGANEYRLRLPATAAAGYIAVYSSRILITQTGATKTKLYIPLLSYSYGPSAADAGDPIEVTNGMSYTSLLAAGIYKKDTSSLVRLADGNPWELETVVASSGGAIGLVSLYNVTRGAPVTPTETVVAGSSVSLVRSPFNEGISNYARTNEGDEYQVTIRCDRYCGSGRQIALYKAGLWVKLDALDKVEVHLRTSLGANISFTNDIDHERTLLQLSAYSNPVVYFQATAEANGGSQVHVRLMSAAASDFGPSVLTPVAGSTVTFDSETKTQLRSPALTLTNGDRYLLQAEPVTGGLKLIDSSLVIRAQR